MNRNYFLVVFTMLLVTTAAAQPQLTNAKLTTRAATNLQSDVNSIIASGQTGWIAYAVPVIAGEHHMCCFNSSSDYGANCCGGCRLENEHGGSFIGKNDTCKLEPGTEFFVF